MDDAPALIPASRPVGRRADLQGLAPGRWAVVGAPVDVGSGGEAGARHGPEIIRSCFPVDLADQTLVIVDHDLERRIEAEAIDVVDVGDVAYVPGESLAKFGARLRAAVSAIIARGRVPLVLGGDHSVSAFAVAAAASASHPIGVLHLDAHTDMGRHGRERLNHANVMAFVREQPGVERILQVGVRGIEVLPRVVGGRGAPVERVSARAVSRLGIDAVLDRVDRTLDWYVSVDIDCLAPEAAPETPCRVPGGLRYYDVLEMLAVLTRSVRLAGADIVEVIPSPGRLNLAGEYAARLTWTLLTGGIEARSTT